MEIGQFYLLDTFTDEAFKGSPTPVCILQELLETSKLHQLAVEFNAPVTAFITPQNKDKAFAIRYFTSEGEIPACGHATLGAGFVLFSQKIATETAEFETVEKLKLRAKDSKGLVYVEYPRFGKTQIEISPKLLEALGIVKVKTHFYNEELQSLFIELEDESKVKDVQPDFEALRKSSDYLKEVVIMCNSHQESFDFILRSFCPWIGIDEDPVTGSIHSVLAPYWQQKTGKNHFTIFQASERGGKVFIKSTPNHVEIGGHSKVLIEGRLYI